MNWLPGRTRELLKALNEQGFQVDETTKGYKVTGHDSSGAVGIVTFHGVDRAERRGVLNLLSDLQHIGFQDPNVWLREQRKYKPTVRAAEATGVLNGLAGAPVPAAKEETVAEPTTNGQVEYKCPDCGKAFATSHGRGAHRWRSHGVVGKTRANETKPSPALIIPRDPHTFDCTSCMKKFVSADLLAQHRLTHSTEQLIEEVGDLIRQAFSSRDTRLAEMQSKLDRLEDSLGNLVSQL